MGNMLGLENSHTSVTNVRKINTTCLGRIKHHQVPSGDGTLPAPLVEVEQPKDVADTLLAFSEIWKMYS